MSLAAHQCFCQKTVLFLTRCKPPPMGSPAKFEHAHHGCIGRELHQLQELAPLLAAVSGTLT